MPSKRAVLEKLKYDCAHGKGDEPCHLVDINEVAKERIKNDKKVTRFVLGCDSPEACSDLHAECHRIIKHVGNKSVAISLLIRAWRDALSNPELDKVLAALEMQST